MSNKSFVAALALMAFASTSPAIAQTITAPNTPGTGVNAVKAANDFATRVFQDPWDMSQRTDLGWFLNGVDFPQPNLDTISFTSGIFSGRSTNNDPNVFLLDTGNPSAELIPVLELYFISPKRRAKY